MAFFRNSRALSRFELDQFVSFIDKSEDISYGNTTHVWKIVIIDYSNRLPRNLSKHGIQRASIPVQSGKVGGTKAYKMSWLGGYSSNCHSHTTNGSTSSTCCTLICSFRTTEGGLAAVLILCLACAYHSQGRKSNVVIDNRYAKHSAKLR